MRIISKVIVVGLLAASCTGCMMTQNVWKDFRGRDPLHLRVKLVDPSMPRPTFTWLESKGRSGTIELTPPLPGCDYVTAYVSISGWKNQPDIVEPGKGDGEYENYLRLAFPDSPSYRQDYEAIPDARCGFLLTMHQVDEFHRRFTEIHAATVNGGFYAAPIDHPPHPKYLPLLPLAVVGDVITSPIQAIFLLRMIGWSH